MSDHTHGRPDAHGQGQSGADGHDHGGAALIDHRGRLAVVLTITVGVLVVEVVGAWISGSLALLADAGHMLTDVAGLTMGLFAAILARRPATARRTWGYRRVEILGAVAQAALLLVVGLSILVESVHRLVDPPAVTPSAMVLFGVVGLIGNIIGLVILAGARGDNLNMRAAFLEVVNDALGSVAVLVAAGVVATTGWLRADAVASLVIGVLIVPRTLRILREAVDVLLESTPRGIDLGEVRAHLLALEHVHDVHDLHASQVATGLPVLSAHIVVDDSCFHDGCLTDRLDAAQRCLAEDFGIAHTTIQFEPARHSDHEFSPHA